MRERAEGQAVEGVLPALPQVLLKVSWRCCGQNQAVPCQRRTLPDDCALWFRVRSERSLPLGDSGVSALCFRALSVWIPTAAAAARCSCVVQVAAHWQ